MKHHLFGKSVLSRRTDTRILIKYILLSGVSKNFGFTKHVAIALTLGCTAGLIWKTWHWNEKRVIAQYYADLSKREAGEEREAKAALEAKFKALEAELNA